MPETPPSLIEIVIEWLGIPAYYDQRCYLKAHLELFGEQAEQHIPYFNNYLSYLPQDHQKRQRWYEV